MGWASGGELAEKIWDLVSPFVEGSDAHEVALGICEAFSDRDCDTLQEAEDLYNTAYPWAITDGKWPNEQFATEEEAREAFEAYVRKDGLRVEKIETPEQPEYDDSDPDDESASQSEAEGSTP